MSETSAGEEFLITEGFISRRSPQRRATLGCLGCIWARREQTATSPFALAAEITNCTGMSSGVISNILKQLRQTEVVSAQKVPGSTSGNPGLQYTPVDTDPGRLFRAALVEEPQCQIARQAAVEQAEVLTPGQRAADLIGELKERRTTMRLSQKDVSETIGMLQATFSKQETAVNPMELQTFLNYAGALGMQVVLQPIEVDSPTPPVHGEA